MGFFDELKKLTRPYDDDEDDFLDEAEDLAEESADEPQKPRMSNPFAGFSFASREPVDEAEESPAPRASVRSAKNGSGKVVNLASGSNGMQVVLAKPDRFESAAEIADHLRDRRAVLMNLETTGKDTARRLIDFLSGVAYAGEGKIKKVAANTYIITPYSVDIMGDLIDELENNGLYL